MNYLDFKPNGSMTLGEGFILEVMMKESSSVIHYRFNSGQPLEDEPIYEAEIKHTEGREPLAYFLHDNNENEVYYISDIVQW